MILDIYIFLKGNYYDQSMIIRLWNLESGSGDCLSHSVWSSKTTQRVVFAFTNPKLDITRLFFSTKLEPRFA